MPHLYQRLTQEVSSWREAGHPCEAYPAIAEILDFATLPETTILQYLRKAQFLALETYWYLRLVENTPHIFDLYRNLFSRQTDLLAALGLDHPEIVGFVLNEGGTLAPLWERIRTDDDFVRRFHLESLRETLTLQYPSYILALAMGAGKTVLIGAIIATEFAMALEYPDGPFVQNALVFAPGRTIIESLRELAQVPYDRILPPRFHKGFAASMKLTFTRDGEKDLPVIRGSLFNVVVTNTEKIRIQRPTARRNNGWTQLEVRQREEQDAEIANLRLQAIASLPHLAVFSDEAHHTYGQSLDTELKKVRKTVDYLHANTNLICVVNTTGTPYFQRQPLKDVVVWYGLSQGIRDGILKDLSGNIHAFSFDDDNADQFVAHVVRDFFADYGDVRLPNGAPARLAIYFPQEDDLRKLRPSIERALVEMGLSAALCLRNTSQSTRDEIDAFNRLNDPAAPHRVILLVNKGTEGWNCPSLFACALARRLRTSNNFVLQAATRCLRQLPGNNRKARIYLSMDNRGILDRQLQETYGETVADLNRMGRETGSARLVLQKVEIPKLRVKRVARQVVRREGDAGRLRLSRPEAEEVQPLVRTTFEIAEQVATSSVLRQTGEDLIIDGGPETVDVYAAAVELATIYRLDLWTVYRELRRIYWGAAEIPVIHLRELRRQIEEQTRRYEVREETTEVALALVRPEGFDRVAEADGTVIYTAEITYPKDREHLLLRLEEMRENAGGFGFHYTPYNFDSKPEKSFFEQLLDHLNQHPDDVEDIYFTGALTDPQKTDFFVEYRGQDNRWHRYTPDFVIRRKDGRCFIVEIKNAQFQAVTEDDLERDGRGEAAMSVEGRKAVALRRWVGLNPELLQYEIIFASAETVSYDQIRRIRQFVGTGG